MRNVIALFMIMMFATIAHAKTEDATSNVPPVLLYGQSSSGIVPIQVDSSGSVVSSGQWTTSGNDIYSSKSGNVGIGSSSPRGKLDVNGAAYFSAVGNVGIGTTVPGSKLSIMGADTANTTRGLNVMDSTGASKFAVTNAGNVGIGTNVPTGAFEVRGTTSWTKKTGANTACNTTCGTSACAFGEDTGVLGTLLACTDATADVCICMGP